MILPLNDNRIYDALIGFHCWDGFVVLEGIILHSHLFTNADIYPCFQCYLNTLEGSNLYNNVFKGFWWCSVRQTCDYNKG